MEYSVEARGDGVAIVYLRGTLEMISAANLREVVTSTISEGNIRIVVDLTDLAFIDSTGLGALIGGLKSTRQAGGDLRIMAPCSQVRLVLELTNVDRILIACDSVDTAFLDA